MTKCEGTGSITKNGVDFFSTDTKDSSHNVPCKIACANCRSPMFDEVSHSSITKAKRPADSLPDTICLRS